MSPVPVASESIDETALRRASRWSVWAVALLLVPNALVFGVRLINTVQKGAYVETTGTEPVPIYGVWKAQHGHPVYEQPFEDSFAVSLYNFGFYHSYGAVARLFGWEAGGLILGARMITVAATLVCAALCAWIIVLGIAPAPEARRRTWMFAALAGLTICISSAGVSWFSITVRPDLLSLVAGLAGLALALAGLDRADWKRPAAAALCFFAAWAVKQSTIGLLGGMCCAMLLARDWRRMFLFGVPPALLAALSLAIGGVDYRFNVITVPGLGAFDGIRHSYVHLASVFVPNAYLWLAPLALLGIVTRREGRPMRDDDVVHARLRALRVVVFVAFCWCLVALTRDGGYRNSLLEAYVAGSVLAAIELWRRGPALVLTPSRLRIGVLALAVLISAGFPVAQLVALDRIGNLTVASPAMIDEARRIESRLKALPKPIFAEESMFGEPWHSTDGRYPAFVLDNYFFFSVRIKGGTKDGPAIEQLVTERRFPTLLLSGVRRLDAVALAAGYRRVPLLDNGTSWPLRLYLRDPDADPRVGSAGDRR